jgi:hypothetical protein
MSRNSQHNKDDKDAPAFANAADDDSLMTPSIELVPGTLPQRPMKDRAPSPAQAGQSPERPDSAAIPEPDETSTGPEER